MAFTFIMRPSPQNMRSPRNSHMRSQSNTIPEERLSVIMENGDAPAPPKESHRPFARRLGFGESDPPPPYTAYVPFGKYADVIGPNGEKFHDLRNNRYLTRRGGWRRLLIITIVAVAIIVGLTVGLVVGLRRKDEESSIPPAASSTTSPAPPPPGPFPEGSYALTTFLDTVNTECTTKPNTWLCVPYSTYSDSPTQSAATFNWIITAASSPTHSKRSSDFSISSSDNPFALTFRDVPLTLLDQGRDSERYAFQISMDKVVYPNPPLSKSGQSSCYYNGTTLQAQLFTKQNKTYPSPSKASQVPTGGAVTGGSDAEFQPWPFAVRVEQVVSGGANVPACFKTTDGIVGERIAGDFDNAGPGSSCSCLYKNWTEDD
ncbi:MAG: hypothetical protein M1833_003663 [Piccolia ochrophora]|nr:MAG: hypothetical protein M1833_003663 [Piccolia ochrophora]